MHEPLHTHDDDVQPGSNRTFGLVFAAFCALVGGLKWWHAGMYWPWWIAAAAFLGLALAAPDTLAVPNRLWTKLGLLLSKIVQPVVMGALFFLTITPIGLLMRATGKDLLRLKRDSAAASYWIVRSPPGPPPDGMRKQF